MNPVLEPGYIALMIVMAVINFPFVIGIEAWIRARGIKRVYAREPGARQLKREKRNAIMSAPTHAVLLAMFLATGLLVPGRESAGSIATTFAITFLWTEVWHYVSHVLMHTRPLHFIHAEHHKSMLTNPWTAVSFSFLEKIVFSLGILGFMAALSQVMTVSVYGVGAYYVFYFFTNVLGHANIELRRPGYYDTWMGKILNTSSYHALHHSRYVGNYGLMTPWCDRLFGTMWEDVGAVQSRAARGEPLGSLREKCEIRAGS